jgi:FkbM family methyltransferase
MSDIVKLLSHLKKDDLVIDVGGYRGDFTGELMKLCKCRVILYEPVPEYAEICRKRFKDFNNVEVINSAVSDINGRGTFYVNKQGSSFYFEWAKSNRSIKVDISNVSDIVKNYKPKVLKLNCEGSEYEILGELNRCLFLGTISEILVQFHKVSSWEKYSSIQNILSKTHTKSYNGKWELWILNHSKILVDIGIKFGQVGDHLIKEVI